MIDEITPFIIKYIAKKHNMTYHDNAFWAICHECRQEVKVSFDYPSSDKSAECKKCDINFDWFSEGWQEEAEYLEEENRYLKSEIADLKSQNEKLSDRIHSGFGGE